MALPLPVSFKLNLKEAAGAAARAEGAVLPVLLLVAWYHGSMPPDPDAAGRGQRCFQCERRDSDSEPSKLGFFMFSLPVPA